MRHIFHAFVLIALLTGGCSNPASPEFTDPSRLHGTDWILLKLTRSDRSNVKLFPFRVRLVMTTNGEFTMRGITNRLSGTYDATESGTVKISPILTTAMMGPGIGLEKEMSHALRDARHFDVRDRRLRIYHGINGVLEFYPDDSDTSRN